MYKQVAVGLTPGQKKKMLSQIKAGKAPSLRLGNNQLKRGNVKLPLTKTQQNKLLKARKTGKGLNIKFSHNQVKRGGLLPLLPVLAGLSAVGTLAGGAAGIARAVNNAKNNARQLQEARRHNAAMESLAMFKRGMGLKKNKRPVKKRKQTKTKNLGRGFFLKPKYR